MTPHIGISPCCRETLLDGYVAQYLSNPQQSQGGPAPLPWPQPTWAKSGQKQFSQCLQPNGWKAVQARKLFHGAQGFTAEPGVTDSVNCSDGSKWYYEALNLDSPYNTRYLTVDYEASMSYSNTNITYILYNPTYQAISQQPADRQLSDSEKADGCYFCSVVTTTSVTFNSSCTCSVDKTSGVKSPYRKLYTHSVTVSIDGGGLPLVGETKATFENTGSDSPWQGWDFPYVEGLSGEKQYVGAPTLPLGGWDHDTINGFLGSSGDGIRCNFQGPGPSLRLLAEPADINTALSQYISNLNVFAGANIYSGASKLSYSDTLISWDFQVNKNGWNEPEDAQNNTTGTYTSHASITLSDAWSLGDCVAMVNSLLANWDLSDDLQYPWRTDDNVNVSPLVMYNEAPFSVTPLVGPATDLNFGNPGPFIDPLSAQCDGTILGIPLPAGYSGYWNPAQKFYNFDGGPTYYGGFVPDGLPTNATNWTDNFVSASIPKGAFIATGGNLPGLCDGVFAQKWAEAKCPIPSQDGQLHWTFTFRDWVFNFRDYQEVERMQGVLASCPGDNGNGVTCSCNSIPDPGAPPQSSPGLPQGVRQQNCSDYTITPGPCGAGVLCISPNGETFPRGVTVGFGTFNPDNRYGAFWQGDMQQLYQSGDANNSTFYEATCAHVDPRPTMDQGGNLPFQGFTGLYSVFGYAFDFFAWDQAGEFEI